MKAIITGANGYLGQSLTAFLIQRQVIIVAVDIHPSSNYSDTNTDLFMYRMLDITDKNSVNEFDWNADVLFFFSSLTGTRTSIENAPQYSLVNEIGLLHTLTAIVNQKAKIKIIFPSTRLVYKGSESPLKEDSAKEFRTIYATNKYTCEQYLQIFSNYYGISYIVFRICVPFGDIDNLSLSYGTMGFMTAQAKKGEILLFGTGNQKRTFTHVYDICSIMYATVQSSNIINDVFNIGGFEKSLREIAEIFSKYYPCKIRYAEWPEIDKMLESGSTVFDSTKLDSILKYRYSVSPSNWIKSLENY